MQKIFENAGWNNHNGHLSLYHGGLLYIGDDSEPIVPSHANQLTIQTARNLAQALDDWADLEEER